MAPLLNEICPTCPHHRGQAPAPRLELLVDQQRVLWAGQDARLTLGEVRMVALLASEPGIYRTYRQIYDALRNCRGFIAGPDGDYQANVRTAVKRLRAKFKAIDPGFDQVRNYAGFGYVWERSP